jgi:hypothetical protein
MADFNLDNDGELLRCETDELVRSIYTRIFWSKASGGRGRVYVCCMSCDIDESRCVITERDIRPDEEKAGQQNILVPTVCGGCEHEWENGGPFLEKRDRAEAGPTAGMKVSGQILRGWETARLLTETCAAEGKELECIPRVVPRKMLLGLDVGLAARTIVVKRTEEGLAKVEVNSYLSTRMI